MRKNSARITKAARLLCALVSVVAAAACGGATGTTFAAAPDTTSALGSAATQTLPLDSYALNASQQAEQTYLLRRIEQICMRDFGFTVFPGLSANTAQAVANNLESRSRRYGITDASIAATRGYHLSAGAAGPEAAQSVNDLPQAERLVLTGPPAGTAPTYQGKPIPIGGCAGKAMSTVMTGNTSTAHTFSAALNQVDIGGFNKTKSDPRVLAVFARWSACMATQGHSYADPFAAAADPRWDLDNSPPGPIEIQTALADISCKHQTDLVGVCVTVESGYEQADIQANAATFARIKQAVDAEGQLLTKLERQYR